ncbi:MAG TPA: hypothetical protein VFA81_06500 [Burkholderiales bacterium]|nr:hypothetical protein [Burkholderiales bacterium]
MERLLGLRYQWPSKETTCHGTHEFSVARVPLKAASLYGVPASCDLQGQWILTVMARTTLLRNTNDGTTAIWYMNGATAPRAVFYSVPLTWNIWAP